jgi:precorrin-2/cobalt-factor-2 C20-methyltransferase
MEDILSLVHKSSIYLPDRLKAAISSRAAVTGRSEANLIREAIEMALALPAESAASSRPDPPIPGRLVGVGVGPGEPDLLTLRALFALRRADTILAPTTAVDSVGRAEATVREAIPGIRVKRVTFEMARTRSGRNRSIDQAASVVLGHLDLGQEVAWITLGDPLVYSTFSSLASRVRRKRPQTIIDQVPGIMAFQALASRTGTVIADERGRVAIRTALEGDDIDGDLADPSSTVVVYKGGRRLPELEAGARLRGRAKTAVAGELLGMPGERFGSLTDLAASGPASYLATVILPATEGGAQ